MPRVQNVHINSMSSTLSVSLIVHAIKSAQSCVRSRTHFEMCFAGTSKSKLVPLLPFREAIYRRKHLFPSEKLSIVRRFIFLRDSLLWGGSFSFFARRRFPLRCTRRFIVAPTGKVDACSSFCEIISRLLSFSREHISYPFMHIHLFPDLDRTFALEGAHPFLEVSVSYLPLGPDSLLKAPLFSRSWFPPWEVSWGTVSLLKTHIVSRNPDSLIEVPARSASWFPPSRYLRLRSPHYLKGTFSLF